ncbi:MAG: 3-hydroxyacyl-CoA dehydrogenase NAD-binding domain-containing protein, partial [Planctomycetales bacterium]
MKVTVLGTGYVGLVTGTCLSETGADVVCVDVDQAKIDRLNAGEIPIYEPGLTAMVERGRQAGRLAFTTQAADAAADADFVFLAVGTPPGADGQADLGYLRQAVEDVAPSLPEHCIVVLKSTVPVGTNSEIFQRLRKLTGRECDVASNPEFLKEG